jgi:hypothetical protein
MNALFCASTLYPHLVYISSHFWFVWQVQLLHSFFLEEIRRHNNAKIANTTSVLTLNNSVL